MRCAACAWIPRPGCRLLVAGGSPQGGAAVRLRTPGPSAGSGRGQEARGTGEGGRGQGAAEAVCMPCCGIAWYQQHARERVVVWGCHSVGRCSCHAASSRTTAARLLLQKSKTQLTSVWPARSSGQPSTCRCVALAPWRRRALPSAPCLVQVLLLPLQSPGAQVEEKRSYSDKADADAKATRLWLQVRCSWFGTGIDRTSALTP